MLYDIRSGHGADAEGISRVILAALRESNPRDYPADVITQVASHFTPHAVLALLGRRTVLVATCEQVIVGTAALDTNVVRSVFVDPEWQGRGVGRLLMGEIERVARQAGCEALSVPSSLTAEAFYARLGYQWVREVVHGDERTVVMQKVL